jgi:excisionase family DNA binding protein
MEPVLPSLITLLGRRKEAMTIPELAKLIRVSKRSLYRYAAKENLPTMRIGGNIRVDPVHVAKWLRARQVK